MVWVRSDDVERDYGDGDDLGEMGEVSGAEGVKMDGRR